MREDVSVCIRRKKGLKWHLNCSIQFVVVVGLLWFMFAIECKKFSRHTWSTLPQFTIALANGSAMGGGVGCVMWSVWKPVQESAIIQIFWYNSDFSTLIVLDSGLTKMKDAGWTKMDNARAIGWETVTQIGRSVWVIRGDSSACFTNSIYDTDAY